MSLGISLVATGNPSTLPTKSAASITPVSGPFAAGHESNSAYQERKNAERHEHVRGVLLDDEIDLSSTRASLGHFRSNLGELTVAGNDAPTSYVSTEYTTRRIDRLEYPLTPTAKQLIGFVNDYFLEKQQGLHAIGRQLSLLFGSNPESALPTNMRRGYVAEKSFVAPSKDGGEFPREAERKAESSALFRKGSQDKLIKMIASGSDRRDVSEFARKQIIVEPTQVSEQREVLTASTWIPATLARHLLEVDDQDKAKTMLILADLSARILDSANYQRFESASGTSFSILA